MYQLPYGDRCINIRPEELSRYHVEVISPEDSLGGERVEFNVPDAFAHPVSRDSLPENLSGLSIAIAINDATRPLPYKKVLDPLMDFLLAREANLESICFYISTGTHKPPARSELRKFIPAHICNIYTFRVHDCDDSESLVYLGNSSHGTPVYVNRYFYDSDIKIIIGNIEPHHFMGYSGGVKTAAIGLAGRETITSNHRMLTKHNAKMGLFRSNPMRMDVEEIGAMIHISYALNVILDMNKTILMAYWGRPEDVMRAGVDYYQNNLQSDLQEHLNRYDLVIASPGGYPKDINLYQAQKAITHASLFAKAGGMILLFAECREGFGNILFMEYLNEHSSAGEIIQTFEQDPFIIGPHKAYQLARQMLKHPMVLISDLNSDQIIHGMGCFSPEHAREATECAMRELPRDAQIAVVPYATHLLPKMDDL